MLGRKTFHRALLGATVVLAGAVPAVHAATLGSSCSGTDWPMFGHDIGRTFSSSDTCISTSSTLVPKWYFDAGAPVTAQPVVSGGVVYAGDFAGKFHALDAAKGTPEWPAFDVTTYDTDHTDYGEIADTAAVASVDGRQVVVFGGGDTLFVLDAATGSLLAHQCLDTLHPDCHNPSGNAQEILSSPVVLPQNGGGALIVVGQDTDESNPSGIEGVVELHLSVNSNSSGPTGQLTVQWQFNPETGAAIAGTLAPQTDTSGHGCGDVWSSPSVLPGAGGNGGTVVFGTGNCYNPDPASPVPQVESVFGIDLLGGGLLWQYNPRPPGNGLDLDFGATPNMLGNGVVGEAGKDGVYYTFHVNAANPNPPISAVQAATASDNGGFIASTAVGRIGGDQAVFGVSTIPLSDKDPQASLSNDLSNPQQAYGVHAIDTVTHQVMWDDPLGPAYGAAVYDNGVVFVPEATTDSLDLLDANTGHVLQAVPLDAPPSSPAAISGSSVFIGSGTPAGALNAALSAFDSFGGIWGLQAVAA